MHKYISNVIVIIYLSMLWISPLLLSCMNIASLCQFDDSDCICMSINQMSKTIPIKYVRWHRSVLVSCSVGERGREALAFPLPPNFEQNERVKSGISPERNYAYRIPITEVDKSFDYFDYPCFNNLFALHLPSLISSANLSPCRIHAKLSREVVQSLSKYNIIFFTGGTVERMSA